MADKADILTTLYTEERVQARQAEDQRATLTNIIIIVVGAGLAFITNNDIGRLTLAVSIPMTIIGLYGAVSTAKYFERWFRHWNHAYAYQAQLFDLHPILMRSWGPMSSNWFEVEGIPMSVRLMRDSLDYRP
jgi:hypothetical protein